MQPRTGAVGLQFHHRTAARKARSAAGALEVKRAAFTRAHIAHQDLADEAGAHRAHLQQYPGMGLGRRQLLHFLAARNALPQYLSVVQSRPYLLRRHPDHYLACQFHVVLCKSLLVSMVEPCAVRLDRKIRHRRSTISDPIYQAGAWSNAGRKWRSDVPQILFTNCTTICHNVDQLVNTRSNFPDKPSRTICAPQQSPTSPPKM